MTGKEARFYDKATENVLYRVYDVTIEDRTVNVGLPIKSEYKHISDYLKCTII